MSLRLKFNIIAKTASFTLDPNAVPSGTRLTNRGAVGTVTCTLPNLSASAPWVGYRLQFYGHADQTFGFAAAAGKGVGLNNAACASITASTGGQKIGALLEAVWDGAQWLFTPLQGTGTLA